MRPGRRRRSSACGGSSPSSGGPPVALGKLLLIAGAVGVGLVVLSRSSATAGPASRGPVPGTAPPPAGTQLNPTFAHIVPPLPGLAQAYTVLKPVEKPLQSALANLNRDLGFSTGPFGPLTSNGDGTYTNGFGDRVTPLPNGKVAITAGPHASWYEKHIGGPISDAGTSVGHIISGLF